MNKEKGWNTVPDVSEQSVLFSSSGTFNLKPMWRAILAIIPWEAVIPWIFARLTDISTEMAKRLVDKATELVIEAERKLGSEPGEKKAEYVNEELSKIITGTSKFVINLLRELAVAYAKKKGLIK